MVLVCLYPGLITISSGNAVRSRLPVEIWRLGWFILHAVAMSLTTILHSLIPVLDRLTYSAGML